MAASATNVSKRLSCMVHQRGPSEGWKGDERVFMPHELLILARMFPCHAIGCECTRCLLVWTAAPSKDNTPRDLAPSWNKVTNTGWVRVKHTPAEGQCTYRPSQACAHV